MTLLQNESRLWQEWEQLEAEKLLFKEQRQTFEEERLKYLDAAKRLDREVRLGYTQCRTLCFPGDDVVFRLELECVWKMQLVFKACPLSLKDLRLIRGSKRIKNTYYINPLDNPEILTLSG